MAFILAKANSKLAFNMALFFVLFYPCHAYENLIYQNVCICYVNFAIIRICCLVVMAIWVKFYYV